jgi:hypothetical protein
MRVRHILVVVPLLCAVPAVADAQTSDQVAAQAHLQQGFARLLIRIAPDSPPGTAIARDGIDLGPISFNSPLAIEVGRHVIVARGGGFQRTYEISIAEGETKEIVVTPIGGEPLAAMAPTPSLPTAPLFSAPSGTASFGMGAASQSGDASLGNGQRIAGLSLVGVGAVGVVIGTIFGLKVSKKNREIDSICPTGQPCPFPSVADYNHAVADAKIDRAAALIGFGVGAVFVGTGAVLVLTAAKREASGVSVWLTPAVAASSSGVACSGTW